MYIQGYTEKSVNTGKCLIGVRELINQRLPKMSEGENFGVVKKLSISTLPDPSIHL